MAVEQFLKVLDIMLGLVPFSFLGGIGIYWITLAKDKELSVFQVPRRLVLTQPEHQGPLTFLSTIGAASAMCAYNAFKIDALFQLWGYLALTGCVVLAIGFYLIVLHLHKRIEV